MKIIKSSIINLEPIDEIEKSVIVIGNFDGIHTYHQKIIKKAQALAENNGLKLIIMTFNQSFEDYFSKTNSQIYSNDEKIALMKQYFEIDYYLELKIDEALMSYDKLMYLNFLKNVLKVEKIVEGEDFKFAKNQQGNVNDLITFFGKNNTYIFKRDNNVSSSEIRKLIKEKNFEEANKFLLKPLNKE